MYHLKIIHREIERPFQPQRAEWVGIASLALGVGSSILGGVTSAAAARRAEQLRQEQDARNNAWFARRYNESYIDTAAGRNAIRQATDYARTMTQRAEGAAAVTGGTDAAVAQAKESANKMIGDTIGNLAAQDTARKDAAEAAHLQQQAQSTAQQMQTQQAKANAISQAASGASNALIAGAQMLNTSNVGGSGQTKEIGNPSPSIIDNGGAQQQAQMQAQAASNAQAQAQMQAQQQLSTYAASHGLAVDDEVDPRVFNRANGLIG